MEGVLVIFILVFTTLLNLELLRRAYYEVLLHHAVFIRARDSVMGVEAYRSRQKICKLFREAMGDEGSRLCQTLELSVRTGYSYGGNGNVAKVYVKYPLFIRVEKEDSKTGSRNVQSNMEITRTCLYPTSWF